MSTPRQYQMPTQCPVCSGALEITRVRCLNCETTLEGHFSQGRFANLAPQQWHFIETFIRCKGKIKDVEVALDISYPTVVARLSEVIRALGFDSTDDAEARRLASVEERRREVMQRIQRNEISPKDAVRLLESIGGTE